MTITDIRGVTVTDSGTATAEIAVDSYETGNLVRLIGSRVFSVKGVLDFTGFTVIANPNSNVRLKLTVNLDSEIDGS